MLGLFIANYYFNSYRCRWFIQTRCLPYVWSVGSLDAMLIDEGFPDPFAVATVGGEQTHTTSVIKKTLNPYWNEIFDLYVSLVGDDLLC